jgi:ribose transport system substrate-binding protein
MKYFTQTVSCWFVIVSLSGCISEKQNGSPDTTRDNSYTAQFSPGMGLAKLKGKVFSTGPNGESPTSSTDIELTDQDIQEIRSKKARAAIVMHYGNNDWSDAQVDGLQAQFEVMGVEVISVTYANFEPVKQAENIKDVLKLQPDIMVAFPIAPAAIFKEAADQGVKIVFMDMLPSGAELKHGTDYVSIVSADSYGNGIASAHLLAEDLRCKGTIGVIFHNTGFFVTNQRYQAFKKTIQENYPDMKIVVEKGMQGPDYAADAQKIASMMFADYPELNAVWTPWDVPAGGVMEAARQNNRGDIRMVTIDLGLNVATALAKGDMVVGVGAQRPYDQGIIEAKVAGYALLGKPFPEYVVLSALPVTKENVHTSWQIVYHKKPSKALMDSIE